MMNPDSLAVHMNTKLYDIFEDPNETENVCLNHPEVSISYSLQVNNHNFLYIQGC